MFVQYHERTHMKVTEQNGKHTNRLKYAEQIDLLKSYGGSFLREMEDFLTNGNSTAVYK